MWPTTEQLWKLVKKYCLVEVLFFIYQAGLAVYQNVFTNGLYWRVCRELYADDLNVNCRRLKDSADAESAVQQYSASWRIYINCASLIPTIVIGPLLGAFGDRNGRKTNILLGATGYICFGVIYMAVLAYNLPLWLIPLAGALSALTGFGGSFSSSCYAYVADREPDKQLLSRRFTFLQVITSIAGIIFGVVTGELLRHLDFVQTYLIHIVVTSAAFLYALVLLRQTVPEKTRAKAALTVATVVPEAQPVIEVVNNISAPTDLPSVPVQVFRLFRSSTHTATQSREGHYRAYMLVILTSFTVINLTTSGLHSLLNLYVLHPPLSWSPTIYADYTSVQSAVSLCGILVSVLILKHFKFQETSILLISMGSLTIKLLLIGLVGKIPVPDLYNDGIMYCAAVCGLAGDLSYPVATAFVSQLVAHDEVGRVYALFQIAIDVAIILVHTVFNALYKVTLDIYAGFVFVLLAGVMLLCMLPIAWVHIDHTRYQKRKLDDMQDLKF